MHQLTPLASLRVSPSVAPCLHVVSHGTNPSHLAHPSHPGQRSASTVSGDVASRHACSNSRFTSAASASRFCAARLDINPNSDRPLRAFFVEVRAEHLLGLRRATRVRAARRPVFRAPTTESASARRSETRPVRRRPPAGAESRASSGRELTLQQVAQHGEDRRAVVERDDEHLVLHLRARGLERGGLAWPPPPSFPSSAVPAPARTHRTPASASATAGGRGVERIASHLWKRTWASVGSDITHSAIGAHLSDVRRRRARPSSSPRRASPRSGPSAGGPPSRSAGCGRST